MSVWVQFVFFIRSYKRIYKEAKNIKISCFFFWADFLHSSCFFSVNDFNSFDRVFILFDKNFSFNCASTIHLIVSASFRAMS